MSMDIRKELGKVTSSKVVQLALTELTGKALDTQSLPGQTAWGAFTRAVCVLCFGVSLSVYSCLTSKYWLLPISWLLSVHAMRYLQLVIVHNAAHGAFVRSKVIDNQIGIWVSALLLVENFEKYKPAHGHHHSRKKLSTCEDPTVQALARAGIKVGYSFNQLMANLVMALFSPRYHVVTTYRRIASYFIDASLKARLTAVFVIGWLSFAVFFSESATVVLLAWLLPVTILYQQSALLRLVVEHNWDAYDKARESLAHPTELTDAIFLGVNPPFGAGLMQWLSWFLIMLLNLIIRLVILPGDSGAAHDFHHLNPRADWPNYIAQRRQAVALAPEKYSEVWGYGTALKRTLRAISKQSTRSAK